MPVSIVPPKSVLLLVGREDFSPPASFGGQTCVATTDCIAIGVAHVNDAAVNVTLGPAPAAAGLLELATFEIETEGHLSLRDVYSREYETIGVSAGLARVIVWGNDHAEPDELVLEVAATPS